MRTVVSALTVVSLLGAAALAGCTSAITQGTIEGTVYDEDQQPVPNAWVTVTQNDTEYARVPTDSAGKYRVTSLEPGTYNVKATPPEGRIDGLMSDGPYPVTVTAGGTAVRNFHLPSIL